VKRMVEVIDATDHIMGRLTSDVAKRLLDNEELEIAIVNSEKAIVSGNRRMIIKDFQAKRKLNHPRKGPNYPRMPDKILKRTIRGMLPYQKPRGKKALRRVKTYIGVPAQFEKSKMKRIDGALKPDLHVYMTLERVSKSLGADYHKEG